MLKQLTKDEIAKAKMIVASTKWKTNGCRDTVKYLTKQKLKMTLVKKYSTKDGLVLIDDKENITIAYRGTRKKTLRDVKADYDLFINKNIEDIDRVQKAKNQIRRIKRDLGKLPVHLIGYSLGGAIAIIVGEEVGIPSTTFNPFITQYIIDQKRKILHKIVRTSTDFASSKLEKENLYNLNVKNVASLCSSSLLNLISAHKLKNFIPDKKLL